MQDTPGKTLTFWFDPASSYSYLSAMRIQDLAAAAGVQVYWRAFLLGPIFRQQGWENSPFNQQPAKLAYMWRDLERTCAARGLAFRRPSVLPRHSVLAARVASHYRDAPWLPEFVKAVYRANFAEDRDIAEPAVIGECLGGVGQDPAAILAGATSAAGKAGLRAATEEAAQLGIFGAPSFVVDGELFWGDDRLEQALGWASGP